MADWCIEISCEGSSFFMKKIYGADFATSCTAFVQDFLNEKRIEVNSNCVREDEKRKNFEIYLQKLQYMIKYNYTNRIRGIKYRI